MEAFPKIYQDGMVSPLINYLNNLGAARFAQIFSHPIQVQHSYLKNILPDLTEAILEPGEMFAPNATRAFQEWSAICSMDF